MPRGSRPGERRGVRAKGTRNKRSLPAIKAAIQAHNLDLDSLSLQRFSAAGVLVEIKKLSAAEKYDPTELIDWYMKLARVAEGYVSFEHPRIGPVEREDRNDCNVEVHADLSRLNAEQLIALKQLALIASGGSTTTISATPHQPDRQGDPRKAAVRGGTGKGRP
jgi:hypothetical protein